MTFLRLRWSEPFAVRLLSLVLLLDLEVVLGLLLLLGELADEGCQLLHLLHQQLYLLLCGCHRGCNAGRNERRVPLPCKSPCVWNVPYASAKTQTSVKKHNECYLLPAPKEPRSYGHVCLLSFKVAPLVLSCHLLIIACGQRIPHSSRKQQPHSLNWDFLTFV